jgi:hydrogenase expression/formation protein HypC
MCLGVPGQVIRVGTDDLGLPSGRVRFGGIVKDVCLAYVPDAKAGDYVLVHVAFALSKVDEAEAARTIALWQEATGEAAAPPPRDRGAGAP